MYLILVVSTSPIFSQVRNNSPKHYAVFSPIKKSKIVEVKIVDSLLLNKLDSLIDHNMNDSLFRSLGIIEIYLNKRGYKFSDTTKYRFCLGIIWSTTFNRITDKDSQFPNFYTIRRNKLIRIYSQGYDEYIEPNFSIKTKRRFIQVLKKYSPRPKPIKVVFDGKRGHKGYYDPNEFFVHGTDLYIYYPENSNPITKLRRD